MNKVNSILEALNESVEVKKVYGEKPEECKKENISIKSKSVKGDKAPKGETSKSTIKFPFGEKPEMPKDNKVIKEEVDECDTTLNEGSERRATDDLLQAIEDGSVDEHTVLLACLKYMSEDDVRDMCHDNEFNIADDEDLDECSKASKEA